MGWLDVPEVTVNQPASLPQHPRTTGVATAAPNATFVSPLPAPVGILAPAVRASAAKNLPATTRKQQPAAAAAPAAAVTANLAASTAAAAAGGGHQNARTVSKRPRTTATPSGMRTGLDAGKRGSGIHAQGSALAVSEQVPAATGRESFGGTQGAITGLTHMALQKHNELQGGPGHHQPAPGLDLADTQVMARQVSPKCAH